MSYTDTPVTVATYTAGEYRARVVQDDAPSEPEDDGSFPILRFERGDVRELSVTSYRLPSLVLQAASGVAREGLPLDLFARLLRIFHSSTTFTTWQHPEDHRITYVAFDTAAWRDYVGAEPTNPGLVADLGGWKHYVTGEVFYVAIEKRVVDVTAEHWRRAAQDAYTVPVTGGSLAAAASQYAHGEQSYTWESVTLVGGFYGEEWAREGAAEVLGQYTEETITEATQ